MNIYDKQPLYFMMICPHCGSRFVFEREELMMVDLPEISFKINCPSCNDSIIFDSFYSETYEHFVPRHRELISLTPKEYAEYIKYKKTNSDTSNSIKEKDIGDLLNEIKKLLDEAITKYVGNDKL